MLSELSDRENRIYTILDIDTMEQAIQISKSGSVQINGSTQKEKKQITLIL